MFERFLEFTDSYSFFLFGARGTGKSTLLKIRFANEQSYWIDLLNSKTETYFAKDPNALKSLVEGLPATKKYIVIDEIQKNPKLLDVVHSLIEDGTDKYFIMTGSSARKLKRGAANLLAGRAFVYHLFPISVLELDDNIDLNTILCFGLLPKVFQFKDNQSKKKFLDAYAKTYLKEEISQEQLTKNINPFRRFLEVAAQMNGKIINAHAIARDVGIDDKTVINYFSILEDTLIGFYLESFHNSFRKRLSQKPKFYFFDVGIARALSGHLTLIPEPSTSYYGELFEAFIIVEIYKLIQYYHDEYKMSYLQTKDGLEIDLVIEKHGQVILLIEIKSTAQIYEQHMTNLIHITEELNVEGILLSQDPHVKKINSRVSALPWQQGIKKYFGHRDPSLRSR